MSKRRLSHPFFLIVIASLMLLLISGCGQTADQSNTGTDPSPADNSAVDQTGGSETEQAIAISGSAFQPGNVTVKAGTTVVWTNQDGIDHQVHDDNNAFLSDTFGKDGAFEIAYNASGTFTYHCHVHGNMKGTIVVQ